jgi:hypothetical protein
MLVQALGPWLTMFRCVECGRTHYELTRDPMLEGATQDDRCAQCVAEHEGARDE